MQNKNLLAKYIQEKFSFFDFDKVGQLSQEQSFIFILSAMNLIHSKLNLRDYQRYMSNVYDSLTMTKAIFV